MADDTAAPVELASRRLQRAAARAHARCSGVPGALTLTAPRGFEGRTGFGPALRPLLEALVDAVLEPGEQVRPVAMMLGRDPEIAPALPGYLVALHHASRAATDRSFPSLSRARRARLLVACCAGEDRGRWESLLAVIVEAARVRAAAQQVAALRTVQAAGGEVIPFPARGRHHCQTNRAR